MAGSSLACQNCVDMILDSSQLFQLATEEGVNYTITKHEFLDSIKQGCPICLEVDSLACNYLTWSSANEAFRRPGSQAWDDEPRDPNRGSDSIPEPGSTADMNQLLIINVHSLTRDAAHYDVHELSMTTWSAENRPYYASYFYVNAEPNDPAAAYVSTRPLNRDVASPASYELAKSWIHECLHAHQACPNNTTASLPSRVIDVGVPDDSEDPRLYISNGQKSSYAALSYCWGEPQLMVLTTSNVDSLTQGINMSKLPQTLQDAVKSVRRLGLRFLWVDTLCIMQDSPLDKDLEIVKMGQYYENAHVTIAAASASACSRGFLAHRPEDAPPLTFSSRIRYPCPDGTTGNINVFNTMSYNSESEPLSRRGWALQELVLSSRVLIYGLWQLYWWCHNGHKCDGGTISSYANNEKPWFVPIKRLDRDNNIEAPPIARSLLWEQWENVVEEYSKRNLTVRSDKFPALSGIVGRFAAASSDTYCAGLWKTHLLKGLTWVALGLNGEVEYEYLAPTWSWASYNGAIMWHRSEITGGNSTGLVSEVIECVVVPENPIAPCGEVQDGNLIIRGIVKLIEWDGFCQIPMDGVDMSTLKLSVEIGSPLYPEGIIAIVYSDYDEEILHVRNLNSPITGSDMKENDSWDEIPFYMGRHQQGLNLITRPVTCLVIYDEFALMLEKSPNGNYVRLGLMMFPSIAKLQEYFNGCEEMTLTIV